MMKGTNNMMYEFVSDDTNEVTKVANALHEALSGNRLYIHNKIVLRCGYSKKVVIDIMNVESCYNQLPKFLETYVEFNKFVKEVIDGTCERVPVTNYLQYDQTITQILAETIKEIPYIAYQEPDALRKAASHIAERYGISKEELYL